MSDYLMIGEVLKPQGICGECKIRPWAAETDLFRRWNPLFLESGGVYSPVPFRLSRIHDGFVYGILGSSASMEDAEKYRGKQLYIDRPHAAPLEEGAVYIADLIGCEAVDENGQVLGKLKDVLQHGPVDTWVFAGPRGGFMAPALKDVFPEVDPDARRIRTVSARLQEVAVFED